MTDVAKLAGVSHQTVSRVINGSPQVRPATRERVLDAMRELDYRPNSAARALVTGRSQTLGVVSFDTTLYGPASTLYAIERAAHDAGYFIMTVSLEALDRDSVLSAVDRLRLQGVDGILVIAPLEGAARGARRRSRAASRSSRSRPGPPRRCRSSPSTSSPAPRSPPGTCSSSATRRSRTSPGRPTSSRPRCASTAGARRSRRAGAEPPPVLVGDWSPRSGYELGRRLVARRATRARSSSPTTRWRSARCARCTRPGYEIPRQVSVVGFDDIPEAQYFTPPLTTVRQDFAEIGRRSLRLMLEMMDAGGDGRRRRRWWRRS